ncbi:MAG TPA: DUF6199 family natural product biosynthesis protein [Candidatus Limnocylindrales bacterium]|nr:DUF6199 family natural product biosynthesis protein [Candidatus Limnocylindrales bacterium]
MDYLNIGAAILILIATLLFPSGTMGAVASNGNVLSPVNPDSLLFFGLFITVIGAVSALRPRLFWYLHVGRKIKDVPPNKLYLLVLRSGGVLVLFLGIYIICYVLRIIG